MTSDEALYKEIRKGSKEAFKILYLRYEKSIFGFIRRRLTDHQDAEDVFHETMLAIFKGAEIQVLNEGAFAAWLYKVAANRSLNKLRSRGRERIALEAFGNETQDVAATKEVDPFFSPELLSELDKSASKLSGPLSEVYRLRRQDKSYEEMAQTLNVPIGTVKSRLNAAVTQLRKDVKKWLVK